MFKTVVGEIAVSRVWVPYTSNCVTCGRPRGIGSAQRCKSCYSLFLIERREMNMRRRVIIPQRRIERRVKLQQQKQFLRESKLLPSFRPQVVEGFHPAIRNEQHPTTRTARLAQRQRLTRPNSRFARELLFQPFQFWVGSVRSPSAVFKAPFSLDIMLDGRHMEEALATIPSPLDLAMQREAVEHIAERLSRERQISLEAAWALILEAL